MESKIPSINGLATTNALTAVQNKRPNVSNLVKKNYVAEILDIKSKYVKQKQLVDQSDIARFINNSNLNKKVAALAKKAELNVER